MNLALAGGKEPIDYLFRGKHSVKTRIASHRVHCKGFQNKRTNIY